jgi:hypothetical protein
MQTLAACRQQIAIETAAEIGDLLNVETRSGVAETANDVHVA